MPTQKRPISGRAIVCSIAIAMVYCLSVLAMQPVLGQSLAFRMEPNQEPEGKPNNEQPAPQPAQPDRKEAKAVALTGTIVKTGSDFVLRDPSGTVYRLDAPEKVQPFEGKSVKVTGKLEADNNLVHVKSIEEITALSTIGLANTAL
jgi:hypothetical protein